ncbi:hypothetical protein LIER_38383 [Lithospermum erythrorhizon]|uniref:Uncharacterized protein n=1 Tax=Lithospermum erythrorhizon TaxID=34254 RepID=A0AAV3PYY3_LITER
MKKINSTKKCSLLIKAKRVKTEGERPKPPLFLARRLISPPNTIVALLQPPLFLTPPPSNLLPSPKNHIISPNLLPPSKNFFPLSPNLFPPPKNLISPPSNPPSLPPPPTPSHRHSILGACHPSILGNYYLILKTGPQRGDYCNKITNFRFVSPNPKSFVPDTRPSILGPQPSSLKYVLRKRFIFSSLKTSKSAAKLLKFKKRRDQNLKIRSNISKRPRDDMFYTSMDDISWVPPSKKSRTSLDLDYIFIDYIDSTLASNNFLPQDVGCFINKKIRDLFVIDHEGGITHGTNFTGQRSNGFHPQFQ